MLPGKTYTPEDVLRILRKRVWLILLPLALISATTAIVVRKLPNYYRSETTIRVVPQRIPQSYVASTDTSTLQERLQSIRPTILSRTRLELIINELDLYPEERHTMVMSDIVDMMRGAIDVHPADGRADMFIVAYIGRDPQKVMAVTNRLAGLYVEESLKDRISHSEDTEEFLDDRLKAAEQALEEKDRMIAEFRTRYAGELPDQYQANLNQASSARSQIQSYVELQSNLDERRLALQRQINDLQKPDAAAQLAAQQSGAGALQKQLTEKRQELAEAEVRLTPAHPDIGILRRQIADLEAKLKAEEDAEQAALARMEVTPAEAERRRQVVELQDQLAAVDKQIAQAKAEETGLRQLAEAAQARADALPTRQSQLAELQRDYGVLQRSYEDLKFKQQNAQTATALEQRQIGEQFDILDPASLPERPVFPDRPRYTMGAMAAGLFLGLAVVGLLEYRDETFKTDDEIKSVLKLPVLAVVPLMRSDDEEKKRFRRQMALNAGLGSLVMGCLALVAYTLVR